VLAIAPSALAVTINPTPRTEVGAEAVLHAKDGTPLAIGTAGTPNTAAAPSLSLWRTDCLAARVILRVSWALRASGAVAQVSGVTW
jgi:hypothetical protein